MYRQEYSKLWLTVVDEEYHKRTCNYWYIVTNGAMGHCAFETKQGLTRWLDERGLKLTAPLTEPGTYSTQKLEGSYMTSLDMDSRAFYALPAILETKAPQNGQYTLARITEDSNGVRTVHKLNPNVERVVFDYFATAKVMR